MNNFKKLKTPLSGSDITELRAGEQVQLSGIIYAARDMAHKRLCETLKSGGNIPFELNGAVIYFLGPTPARPGKVIGSAGPTTASRMDAFSPQLIECGLKATIGKGYRNQTVRDAMKQHKAVHFAALGGAGALLSKYIVSAEVIAYEDLGTEAIRKLEVNELPLVVAYDSYGGSIFK
ncbi:MAG: Fe-S-containing hydro-lyase [Phycisphaerae bacterium]